MTSQDWMRGHRMEAWRHEEKKQSRQQHSLGIGRLKAAASVSSGDRECGCWREPWCNVMSGRGTLLVCRPGPSKGLMSLGDRKYQGNWNHVEAEEQTIPRGQGEGSGTVGKTRTTVWCADDNGLNASQLLIIHSLNNPGASDGGCHM